MPGCRKQRQHGLDHLRRRANCSDQFSDSRKEPTTIAVRSPRQRIRSPVARFDRVRPDPIASRNGRCAARDRPVEGHASVTTTAWTVRISTEISSPESEDWTSGAFRDGLRAEAGDSWRLHGRTRFRHIVCDTIRGIQAVIHPRRSIGAGARIALDQEVELLAPIRRPAGLLP